MIIGPVEYQINTQSREISFDVNPYTVTSLVPKYCSYSLEFTPHSAELNNLNSLNFIIMRSVKLNNLSKLNFIVLNMYLYFISKIGNLLGCIYCLSATLRLTALCTCMN